TAIASTRLQANLLNKPRVVCRENFGCRSVRPTEHFFSGQLHRAGRECVKANGGPLTDQRFLNTPETPSNKQHKINPHNSLRLFKKNFLKPDT
ncbi:MAG: hypothetical protein ACKO3T_15830, partial [Planctomycetaceae bacterium]